MKSLEEIKSISNTYNGGPILKVALEDAIKWIEAYREVANMCDEETPIPKAEWVDAEAARIVEQKK